VGWVGKSSYRLGEQNRYCQKASNTSIAAPRKCERAKCGLRGVAYQKNLSTKKGEIKSDGRMVESTLSKGGERKDWLHQKTVRLPKGKSAEVGPRSKGRIIGGSTNLGQCKYAGKPTQTRETSDRLEDVCESQSKGFRLNHAKSVKKSGEEQPISISPS